MSRRRRPARPRLTFGKVLSHLTVIVGVSVVLGVLVAGLVVPAVGLLGVTTKATADSMQNLPTELKAAPLSQRSRILDRNGKVIATFYDQNRVNVRLNQVAPIMRRAIVAIEDYRFYEHGALDMKGTLRALINNQAGGGGTQGGSSITQQMAKLTQLAQAKTAAERRAATANTYQRKILELRHAIAFEQNYSKNWILERYLNLAYFGDGAYGIQAAARHYFSVNASQLNTAQAALLAGLVKNPVGFDPTTYKDRALARRNVVLARMAQLKILQPDVADRLERLKLGLKVSKSRNGCLGTSSPLFCDYVRRYLLADPSLGKTVQDRVQLLNNGGLTIKTTLDKRFEKAATDSVTSHVYARDNAIGALAMIDPGTGEVRAIAQSRPFGDNKKKGETFLDYVVDNRYGEGSAFQPGSTFKLFTLAAALEQGLPTSTAFVSPEVMRIPSNTFPDCDGNYASSEIHEWHNSTTTGSPRFDMYKGTQLSVNTYFAQLERKTGLCAPYAIARKMGVQLDDPGRERVPTFTLGVGSASPLEMAEAYATVAARGMHCDARPVTEVLNASDRVFKKYPAKCERVLKESTADTISDILRGVMEGSGFGAALALDKPSAGKTGTTSENKAVWFCGYTPTLATAAMVAGANSLGHPVPLNGVSVGGSTIGEAFGSTVAGPLWRDAMRSVQDLLPDEDFQQPERQVDLADQVTIPDVRGERVSRAVDELSAAGFFVSVQDPRSSDQRKGRVAFTDPGAGETARPGETVYVFPSSGR